MEMLIVGEFSCRPLISIPGGRFPRGGRDKCGKIQFNLSLLLVAKKLLRVSTRRNELLSPYVPLDPAGVAALHSNQL